MIPPFSCLVSGHVNLPVELFEYQPAHHAAMVRAFGGLVIAKDDVTATQLVTQFGMACITLDGKISRPGSMQVGRLISRLMGRLMLCRTEAGIKGAAK